GYLFGELCHALLFGERLVLGIVTHDRVLPRRGGTETAQPCGFASARKSSALSSTSSATPRSRATSRSDRPDEAASLTISLAASYPMWGFNAVAAESVSSA